MGWFLFDAAVGSYRQVQLNDLLSRHRGREAMEQICAAVPPDMHAECLISGYASQRAQQCFAVMSGEALEGLVFCDNLRALKRKSLHKQTVAQLMVPQEKLVWVDPDDGLDMALNAMRENEMSQVPVMQDGKVVGVVNYEKLQWLIDAHSNRKQ
ncbi:MAG: CBS domain-containing protein [Dehalococcoidia bacterium]|nr:CBS domain-containing protein [Dehalococcoidia bacterium]